MKENPILPEDIKIDYIDVVNTYVNDSNIDDHLDINFNIAHNTKHNLEDERIKIELFIDLLSESEKGVKFKIDFFYCIDKMSKYYTLNDEKTIPTFSSRFIMTLLGISYSTARGVIFQQLQETNFKNLILPVVAPSKILKSRINNERET